MSTINVNFSDLAEFYPDGTHVTRGVYIHRTGSAVSAVGSVPTVSVLTEETNTPSDWRFKYDSGSAVRYWDLHMNYKEEGRSKVEAFASMTKMFYARDIEMGRVYIRGNGCCN